MIPSLGNQFVFISAPGNDRFTLVGLCNIPNYAKAVVGIDLFIIRLANGEQHFVIFTAAECAGGGVQLQFISKVFRLLIHR